MAVGFCWLEAKQKSVKQSKNCTVVSAFMVFQFDIAQLQDLFWGFCDGTYLLWEPGSLSWLCAVSCKGSVHDYRLSFSVIFQ